jgi:hypothetical protein
MIDEIVYDHMTGVVSSNKINWEYMDDGICLICDEAYRDIQKQIDEREIEMNSEKEMEIPDFDRIEELAIEIEDLEEEMEFFSCEDHEKLIGDWVVDDNGYYIPDANGEFAAFQLDSTFNCIQVVWSKTIAENKRPCSLCFPNQADLDSEDGNLSAYTLPDYLIYNPEEN